MTLEFQFLIGRIKTTFCELTFYPKINFNSLQVGSKPNCYFISNQDYFQFQFLIGRIKTPSGDPTPSQEDIFQFLIGRIKTKNVGMQNRAKKRCFNSLQVGSKRKRAPVKVIIPYSFNSLQVGSKQRCYGSFEGGQSVSIPYRQDQNYWSRAMKANGQESFNSLQVGSKHSFAHFPIHNQPCFNSLQVGSKRRRWGRKYFMIIIHFNSLQVGSKPQRQILPFFNSCNFNSLQVGSKPIASSSVLPSPIQPFQFLIGRIKTICQTDHIGIYLNFNSLQVGSKLFGRLLNLSQLTHFNSLQVGSKHGEWKHYCPECQDFNSLQVGSKRGKTSRFKGVYFEFQFLIGRIKTIFQL